MSLTGVYVWVSDKSIFLPLKINLNMDMMFSVSWLFIKYIFMMYVESYLTFMWSNASGY